MARKKSIKKAANDFIARATELENYCAKVDGLSGLADREKSWAFEGALIKLDAAFERMILHALVGAINNKTSLLSTTTGVTFPRHLTDEVCEFVVTGGGYFDFKGRAGLISVLKKFLPETHYVVVAAKDPAHKEVLDRVFAMRNYAAHESARSKRLARVAAGKNFSSAGSWLKRRNRFSRISAGLRLLAEAIEDAAPY